MKDETQTSEPDRTGEDHEEEKEAEVDGNQDEENNDDTSANDSVETKDYDNDDKDDKKTTSDSCPCKIKFPPCCVYFQDLDPVSYLKRICHY